MMAVSCIVFRLFRLKISVCCTHLMNIGSIIHLCFQSDSVALRCHLITMKFLIAFFSYYI